MNKLYNYYLIKQKDLKILTDNYKIEGEVIMWDDPAAEYFIDNVDKIIINGNELDLDEVDHTNPKHCQVIDLWIELQRELIKINKEKIIKSTNNKIKNLKALKTLLACRIIESNDIEEINMCDEKIKSIDIVLKEIQAI